MMKFWLTFFAALTLALPPLSAHAADSADAILGLWHTTDDKSQVRIVKRGNQYFGQIASLTRPNWPNDDKSGMGGKPKNDRNNPDPALRTRPIVGIEIMHDFVYAGQNVWADGRVYDPENGKTYKGKITLLKTGQLQLRGYVGISLFGRTVTWTR